MFPSGVPIARFEGLVGGGCLGELISGFSKMIRAPLGSAEIRGVQKGGGSGRGWSRRG